MKYVHPDKTKVAFADGHYTHAIKLNDGGLYISGQLGFDPETGEISGNIEQQTMRTLKNIEEILKTENYSTNNVVKATIMLRDIEDFAEVNRMYETFFKGHKPTRSTFATTQLPRDALIEIDLIAYK